MQTTIITPSQLNGREGDALGRAGIRIHGNQFPMMLRGRPRWDWMLR